MVPLVNSSVRPIHWVHRFLHFCAFLITAIGRRQFFSMHVSLKVKVSPKSNRGFICNWIGVKPLCKSIITMKEALLRFTMFAFSGTLILNGSARGIDTMASKSLFLTQRRLDTTWNFACSITRVSSHEHAMEMQQLKWVVQKPYFSQTLCTQTMFSMLVFMCRGPGDTTSKVSCCVEPF